VERLQTHMETSHPHMGLNSRKVRKMVDNPIEWYEQKYCKKCKTRPCEGRGGVYSTNWNAKLFCILSAVLLLELDRQKLKELGKK